LWSPALPMTGIVGGDAQSSSLRLSPRSSSKTSTKASQDRTPRLTIAGPDFEISPSSMVRHTIAGPEIVRSPSSLRRSRLRTMPAALNLNRPPAPSPAGEDPEPQLLWESGAQDALDKEYSDGSPVDLTLRPRMSSGSTPRMGLSARSSHSDHGGNHSPLTKADRSSMSLSTIFAAHGEDADVVPYRNGHEQRHPDASFVLSNHGESSPAHHWESQDYGSLKRGIRGKRP
jgi:hypothetical protein